MLVYSCNPPAVPYLGMYLTDLAFIEEGTPNFTEEGLVNFSKMRMVIFSFVHLPAGVRVRELITDFIETPLHLPWERQRWESDSSSQSSIPTFRQAGYFHGLNFPQLTFSEKDSKSSCLNLVDEQEEYFLNNQNYRSAVIQQEAVTTVFFSKCALVCLKSAVKLCATDM